MVSSCFGVEAFGAPRAKGMLFISDGDGER